VKNAIISGACRVVSKRDRLVPRRPQRGDRERDEQPSDDGRGDVVAGERPDPPLQAVSHEQNDPGGRERADEVEGDQGDAPGRGLYAALTRPAGFA